MQFFIGGMLNDDEVGRGEMEIIVNIEKNQPGLNQHRTGIERIQRIKRIFPDKINPITTMNYRSAKIMADRYCAISARLPKLHNHLTSNILSHIS